MVYLSRIYTKTGDTGETGLGDGTRVRKDHPRIEAIAGVDELNAVVGLVIAMTGTAEAELLRSIQNDLFDVGADLCLPEQPGEQPGQRLRITEAQAGRLEPEIDRLNADLQPLRSFVLPGGSAAAAWSHFARVVCRAAERAVITLAATEPVNPHAIVYLNRLSDLFFVMARVCNDGGRSDVLWRPGQSRA